VEKESVEQVKFRAPYFYTTQNRAVTQNDYETLILKDYNYIDSVSVWGGEDNDPIVYGKVFISLKTNGNYVLTNFEKERIKSELIQKRNVLTVTPEIIDPDYVFLIVKGNVTYNPQLTSLDSGALLNLVKAAITDYSDNELNSFSSTFRKSKLQQYIENCEPSITGSDIQIYVQKRFPLDTINITSYQIQYKLPIRQLPHKDKMTSFPQIKVYDNSGIIRNVFIEEVPEAKTGIEAVKIIDGGRSFTKVPTVTILGDGRGATAKAEILSGKLSKIIITSPGSDYTYATAVLDNTDGYGTQTEVLLQADEGTLRTYYYKDTGEKIVVNDNAGVINYMDGTITLNSLRTTGALDNEFYSTDYLTLTIQAQNEIIPPLRNRILSIDNKDSRSVQVTMVAE
jgi:hypothetical protein